MSVPAKKIVLHMISHGSGELVEMLARNAVLQLEQVEVERRLWKMVRRMDQLPEILGELVTRPGFVLHSISHNDLREALEKSCRALDMPYQFALDPMIGRLADYSGAAVRSHNSSGDLFDDDYFRRVEAMKYTLAHDDGLNSDDIEGADVVVVGVSRATKTPTCLFLASHGIKAANVPLVPGVPPPSTLLRARAPLVVGLTVEPSRLAMIRAARLKTLQDDSNADYADFERLRKEVLEARRLFHRYGWPTIDATQRSIEQTASLIIDMLKQRADKAP